MKRLIKNLFTKKVAESFPKIYEDDIFLVSYPKSGNTWLKFIFSNYLTGESVDFTRVHTIIPELGAKRDDIEDIKFAPKIYKSHSSYSDRFYKVIYIIRDGRDVAVSYFFYLKKTYVVPKDLTFSAFLSLFINGEVPYGKWAEHVYGWVNGYKASQQIKIVSYEDLLLDTTAIVSELIQFIGWELDEAALSKAIENASFSTLTSMEKENHDIDKYLKGTDKQIPFIRRGVHGDYLNYFSIIENQNFFQQNSALYHKFNSLFQSNYHI